MASETVSELAVQQALTRLTRVQGILSCAADRLDARVGESGEWAVAEAVHGALELLDGCYSTLVEATSSQGGL
jgi:hypothetical protein